MPRNISHLFNCPQDPNNLTVEHIDQSHRISPISGTMRVQLLQQQEKASRNTEDGFKKNSI